MTDMVIKTLLEVLRLCVIVSKNLLVVASGSTWSHRRSASQTGYSWADTRMLADVYVQEMPTGSIARSSFVEIPEYYPREFALQFFARSDLFLMGLQATDYGHRGDIIMF